MRALRGIQNLYHSTLNYKSYNFMGVPDIDILCDQLFKAKEVS